MTNFKLLLATSAAFALCAVLALGESEKKGKPFTINLEGKYDRLGVVDRVVEAQFEGLGLVLVPPVFIDELLPFPKRGTRADADFIVRKRSQANYVMVLPKAEITSALSDMGSVVELPDGSLLLRRSVTITGEGTSSIRGEREERITKEKSDGAEWLVVETRIEMMKRSWFQSKKVEYRSLVRFRELPPSP